MIELVKESYVRQFIENTNDNLICVRRFLYNQQRTKYYSKVNTDLIEKITYNFKLKIYYYETIYTS